MKLLTVTGNLLCVDEICWRWFKWTGNTTHLFVSV